jgi:hypothetical protein
MQRKFALALGCLILPAAAFADTSAIKASNNQVGIQYVSTYVDYTETGNGTGGAIGTLDTETGSVPGFGVSVSIMKDMLLGNDYFEAKYDHSSGYTHYIGALCGGGGCGPYGSYTGTSGAALSNLSLRYGTGITLNDGFMLTPYAELGWHEWNRGVNTGETYSHDWLGIGALGQYSPVNKLVLSASILVGQTFGSYITVNPSFGPGGGGFSGSLGNSDLYRLGISADYAFMEHFHGTFDIDYSSFSYGMSSIYPVGGGYVAWEPDSKTYYTTARVGLGYSF